MRIGSFGDLRFLEYLIQESVAGRELRVRIQPSRGGGHPFSYPWAIRAAHGRRSERARLQGFDAAEIDPIVLVDNRWEPDFLAESAAAQLIDWSFRIDGEPGPLGYPNCPSPSSDALNWWLAWLGKGCKQCDEVGYLEARRIALRSVRPSTPSGHRKYWSVSLRPRHETKVDYASRIANVSRSGAYDRLKRAGRRPDEFASVGELADFLKGQARADLLSPDQRAFRDALIEHGMTPGAARKLEYRWRNLAPEEKKRRLLRRLHTVNRIDLVPDSGQPA